MRKLYRRQLVRTAGRHQGDGARRVAKNGINYLYMDGVRIPRSMRHLIDLPFIADVRDVSERRHAFLNAGGTP